MSAPPETASRPAAAKPSWLRRAARHPWIFQVVILAILIALAVWQIDFKQVAQSFKHADYAWLTVALNSFGWFLDLLVLWAFGPTLQPSEGIPIAVS